VTRFVVNKKPFIDPRDRMSVRDIQQTARLLFPDFTLSVKIEGGWSHLPDPARIVAVDGREFRAVARS
jgi:hypothetical protein